MRILQATLLPTFQYSEVPMGYYIGDYFFFCARQCFQDFSVIFSLLIDNITMLITKHSLRMKLAHA